MYCDHRKTYKEQNSDQRKRCREEVTFALYDAILTVLKWIPDHQAVAEARGQLHQRMAGRRLHEGASELYEGRTQPVPFRRSTSRISQGLSITNV